MHRNFVPIAELKVGFVSRIEGKVFVILIVILGDVVTERERKVVFV